MATTTGIRKRHSRNCSTRNGRNCNCTPSYEAWVYSKRDAKKIRKTFSGKGAEAAAKRSRADATMEVNLRRLRAPERKTLRQEIQEWLEGARSGAIRNKRDQP